MALEQKYVVFKRDVFEEEIARLGSDARHLSQAALAPDSSFVIRRGDIFASGGLHGYATNIFSTVTNISTLAPTVLTSEQIEGYLDLSFEVSELSRKWETEDKKLPD